MNRENLEISELFEAIINILLIPALIFLVIFIGRAFMKLSKKYTKDDRVYTILGIVIFFVGIYMGGALIHALRLSLDLGDSDFKLLALIRPACGLLITWGLYIILERKWSKEKMI